MRRFGHGPVGASLHCRVRKMLPRLALSLAAILLAAAPACRPARMVSRRTPSDAGRPARLGRGLVYCDAALNEAPTQPNLVVAGILQPGRALLSARSTRAIRDLDQAVALEPGMFRAIRPRLAYLLKSDFTRHTDSILPTSCDRTTWRSVDRAGECLTDERRRQGGDGRSRRGDRIASRLPRAYLNRRPDLPQPRQNYDRAIADYTKGIEIDPQIRCFMSTAPLRGTPGNTPAAWPERGSRARNNRKTVLRGLRAPGRGCQSRQCRPLCADCDKALALMPNAPSWGLADATVNGKPFTWGKR